MNKKAFILVAGLMLTVGLSTKVMADTETEITEETIAKVETKEVVDQVEELDLTPKFKSYTITTGIGSVGQLELIAIKDVTDNSGTYKVTIKDDTLISVNEKGQWQSLKEGVTSFTVTYSYSPSALKEINQKYPTHKLVEGTASKEFTVNVTTGEPKHLDITPKFLQTELSNLLVGDTGVIKVAAVEGIEVTGKFMPINDTKSIISFDEKGNWKALKPGETSFGLMFEYSKESLKAIQEKFPDHRLIIKEFLPLATVKIYEPLDMKLRFLPATIETQVGDTGKLTIASIGGVDNLAAVYTIEDKNGVIEVDKEGNWKALKAGETNIAPVAELTAESLQRIKEKNPFGKEMPQKAIQELISVKVTEKPLAPKKIDPKAITPGKKNLPQTSESGTSVLIVLGSLIIIGTFSVKKKIKYSE